MAHIKRAIDANVDYTEHQGDANMGEADRIVIRSLAILTVMLFVIFGRPLWKWLRRNVKQDKP